MLARFRQYLAKREMISAEDRVLLGVSGGRDSMVMLDLFRRNFSSGEFAVAHCNFGLRGDESEGDERLVGRVCENYGIGLHIQRFDTEREAKRNNESIQMAARRLRYGWFEELCREEGYTKVAIAHQADDSVETFFINLMRGTGLRGLTGIHGTRGNVIRPLLFAGRDEVTAYAERKGIEYRDDSTNGGVKYLRSRLRNEIIPKFSTSGRDFTATMEGNLSRLQQAQRFIDERMERLRERVVSTGEGGRVSIDLGGLSERSLRFELHELLYPYGLPAEAAEDMARVIRYGGTLSGKEFRGERWTAVLDRGKVVLSKRQVELFSEEWIAADDPRLKWFPPAELPDSLVTEANAAYLTADALKFPLHLRKWRQGDWFIPLGMMGKKKVSDYLIDAKVSGADKAVQGVLVSAETIVWLTGRRIDERYKVVRQAKRIVRITL